MARYEKAYESEAERLERFAIFRANLLFIEAENAKGLSYRLGVNQFADLTAEEFASQRFGLKRPSLARQWAGKPKLGTHRYSGAPLPTSIDWVAKGAVTPPKNQLSCGSCWTFASTGSLEGAWQVATGKLVSLSEQQLVDCSKNDGNSGCRGGDMDAAFTYLESNPVCTEESYPYLAQDGTCRQTNCTAGIPQNSVKGYKDVTPKDDNALMEALAMGPVAVAIEADQSVFQLYAGGVLTQDCGTKLDHGVLAVGYGTDATGGDYWKVKNSWGPQWGEAGFIRIKRGIPGDGQCGIKDEPTYPIVSAPSEAKESIVV